jgi:hypothetical protein
MQELPKAATLAPAAKKKRQKPPQPTNHGLWRFFIACWISAKSLLYSAKVLEMNLS